MHGVREELLELQSMSLGIPLIKVGIPKSCDNSLYEKRMKKALLEKPDDALMHNNLGLALKNQGKYKEAVKAYEKALQLKPDYYEAMNNLAVTYEMLGDNKKAKLFYKKALSLKPSYAEAHLNYALLLEAEGDKPTAESHYQTFLNLSSNESLKNKVKERLKGIKK
jgi:Flp pilus assembly protein TadD